MRAVTPVRASWVRSRNSLRSQAATGTPKPIFGRSRTSSGTQPRPACFSSHLLVRPRIFMSAGREAANSITLWSSNGERASSELAIVAMSIFTSRSPGR